MKIKVRKRRPKGQYDFYRDGVTQSMIQKWLQCPKQAELEYVHKWTTYGESEAILFGNVCHHVLEQAYKDYQPPTPGVIRCWIKEYEERNQDDSKPIEIQERNELVYSKAEATMLPYFQHYQADFKNNWLFTETVFKEPIALSSGRTTFISGKIDGGFHSSKDDSALWLIDHKTTSRPDIDTVIALLPVDLQVWTYLVACKARFPDTILKGFIYNIIRRPGQKMTQKDLSYQMYIDRVSEKVLEDPKYFFDREPLPIVPSEIDEYKEKQLIPILDAMERWFLSSYKWPAYFNPGALKTIYGLASMTKAIVSQDFTGLYQRDHLFSELIDE